MAIIGRRNTLPIVRAAAPGLYLDGGELGEILLPGRYIPRNVKPGDRLEVFVYLDSEDRLVATTETPKVMVGGTASLQVVSMHPRAGAFLDWGLAKDLLLPFREQAGPVRPGQWVTVRVLLDAASGRIVASARLPRPAAGAKAVYRARQAVELVVTGRSPQGYEVRVDDDRTGWLPQAGTGGPLEIGRRVKGFIRQVRSDGRLEVTSDPAGGRPAVPLREQIVAALVANGGRLELDDDSPPAAVRLKFGCSKKAFKQALGGLYKSRRITFEPPGIRLLEPGTARTGG
jgi:predicted RNA-binding protein (virulence factor B family)